jgi:hypothetical protein
MPWGKQNGNALREMYSPCSRVYVDLPDVVQLRSAALMIPQQIVKLYNGKINLFHLEAVSQGIRLWW